MSLEIRMQADGFFNAYRVLSEHQEVMINSLAEEKPLAGTEVMGVRPIGGVNVVCLAFSVELYIKDIYFLLKMELPRGRDGHNILKLYQGLPEQTQQNIFSHDAICQNPFNTRGNIFSSKRFTSAYSPQDGFIDQIEAISDGFQKWRYSYESRSLQYDESFALHFI